MSEELEKNRKLLSIIIINYKTPKITRECILSIKKCLSSDIYEVIVVDNASDDQSLDLLSAEFADIKVIGSYENLGYGRAVNLGARYAAGEYLLILNSDITLTSDITDILAGFYERNNAGAIGIRLLTPEGRFQNSFGYFPNPSLIIANEISFLKMIKSRYTYRYAAVKGKEPETQKVDWVTGAFMFISKERFNKVGGFDNNIFMYYEDVDLCKKLRDQGFDNYYFVDIYAIHKHCATVDSLERASYNLYKVEERRSAIYFVKKYFPKYEIMTCQTLKAIFFMKKHALFIKNLMFPKNKNLFKINTIKEILKVL